MESPFQSVLLTQRISMKLTVMTTKIGSVLEIIVSIDVQIDISNLLISVANEWYKSLPLYPNYNN